MRRVSILGIVALLASLTSFSLAAAAATPQNVEKVIITFDRQPGASEAALIQRAGGNVKYTYHLVPAIAASVPQAAIDGLRRNPRVLSVEPDIEVFAIDAELDNAWGVKRIGAGSIHSGGNKGSGVSVAIIDSGIDYNHPDLDGNYRGGWDFVNDDNDPMDDHGHGTHVAGTVAAEDNEAGVVGVAPSANIYALKVLSSSGSGYYSDVVAAVQWAVDHGIQVTNNSYGSSGYPGDATRDAFANAEAAGVLNIAAAGNSGNRRGAGDNVGYPARFPSVVAVAATDSSDRRAYFSSTGPDVEIAAPGVAIYSTVRGGGYEAWSGTSMASPHVAGTGALVMAKGVTDANGNGRVNDEVRLRLRATADDLGDPGADGLYGFGLVDALEAAGDTVNPPADTPPTVSWVDPSDGSTLSGTVPIRINASDTQGSVAVEWQVDGGAWQTALFNATTGYYESAWATTQTSDGSHALTARGTDTAAQVTTATISVTVGNAAPGVVIVTSINPSSIASGTTADATISGSGFSAGASVTFENGNGPAPIASNVVVVGDNTITATITVGSGGPPRPRVWDVRVTNVDGSSGVLAGGFTVTR